MKLRNILLLFAMLLLPITGLSQSRNNQVSTPTTIPMDVRVNVENAENANQDQAMIRTFGENYIEMLQRITIQNENSPNPDPRLNLFPANYELVSGVITNGVRLQINVNYNDLQNRGPAPVSQKNLYKKLGIRIVSNIGFDILGRMINRDIRTPREAINNYTEIPVPDIYYFQITISARFVNIVDGKETTIRNSVEPRAYSYEVYKFNQMYNNIPRVFWKSGGEIELIGFDDQDEFKPTQYVVQGIERGLVSPRTVETSDGRILPRETAVTPLSMEDDTYKRSQAYGAALSLLKALRWDKVRTWR